MTKIVIIHIAARRQAVYLLLVFFISLSFCCKAQNTDTTKVQSEEKIISIPATDSTGIVEKKGKPKIFQPIPKKAGLYSAILPGSGQFYNRQYWKLPIIYGGFAIAAYYIKENLDNYLDYRKAYIGSINNPNRTDKYADIYTTAQLKILQDDYSKYLDLTVLFTGLGYVAQILDAVAFAHLHNFDISGDLSLRIKPVACPQGAGIGLVVNFK